MGKYLIEIKNGGDQASCIRAIQVFLESRCHLIESVEWGCNEEGRKAWLVIKADSEESALRVVPAAYRQNTFITRLHKFTEEETVQTIVNYQSEN